MKQQRNISGIYFRVQNPETERWENLTFEDLEEAKQDEILSKKSHEWVASLAKSLAKKLREICDQFDIVAE